jgi:nanoRNase/pAp phosphatase (c-di-AMP/oligoRNAs hydrolase)
MVMEGKSAGTESAARAAHLVRLGQVLEKPRRVLIYCHMNPDPDSLGAALAMRQILQEEFGREAGLTYRGLIGRAENRRLAELLAPDLQPARKVDQSKFDAAFLVDAQPGYGYLSDVDRLPLIGCVDHHPFIASTKRLPFFDVRTGYGSTCTIMTEYLQDCGLVPEPRIATALFLGIKSDTQDLTRRTNEADVKAYEWLLRKVDRDLLAKIQNPPLKRDYFDELRKAMSRALVYQRCILTELGHVSYPDMVADVADRLLRLEDMQWSACFGSHERRIYFSVRSSGIERDAGELVKTVLGKDGVGGGHVAMAAGRVEMPEDSKELYLKIVTKLWRRFLRALGEDPRSGKPLLEGDAPTQRIML